MINLNYQKRKNADLFKTLEKENTLFLSNIQNYIPIYRKFFSINDTNYNSINLNHKWYISNIHDVESVSYKLKNIENNKTKNAQVFFKLAPLLDPYKYLIGKYKNDNTRLFELPNLSSNETTVFAKYIDNNNSAYIDSFFLFLTSNLIHSHNFIHGVDFYGSYLAIKNNFEINVFDDIEYLHTSEFFNENRNTLFTVEDYSHLFEINEHKLKPITIQHGSTAKSMISVKSFDDNIFEDIFEDTLNDTELTDVNLINLTDNENNITLNSNSSCSSRSSHTSVDNEQDDDETCEDDELCEDDETCEQDEQDETCEQDEQDDEEQQIILTIPKFPVNVIGMEHCENTFDDLIITTELTNDEWFSVLMQIIMILITYQKTFSFTHNDLHTNNVMYNNTDKKYIYYCYNNKYYKVPTFGRIFKIIDFGRSIYKFNGAVFCSDSFQKDGDAATQYNTEPYFNENKPRIEPNFSFDLCRLACSIFDYVIEDITVVKDIKDPLKRLISEWCLDDKGLNVLYKNNGADRYPDFKLYKMISRCVHNHTPQAQLNRPEFKRYLISKEQKNVNDCVDINIDKIQCQI